METQNFERKHNTKINKAGELEEIVPRWDNNK